MARTHAIDKKLAEMRRQTERMSDKLLAEDSNRRLNAETKVYNYGTSLLPAGQRTEQTHVTQGSPTEPRRRIEHDPGLHQADARRAGQTVVPLQERRKRPQARPRKTAGIPDEPA